jgi:hypothetical protein
MPMARATDPRYDGVVGRFVLPGLTGITASGLLVAALALGQDGSIVALVILVGGAALVGIVVGNPGNAAVLLAGTLLPGVLLIAIEPHHACFSRVAPFLVIIVGAGIAQMFIGLIGGLIVGRRAGIEPVRRPIAIALLTGSSLLAASGWIALGLNLSTELRC